MTPFNVFGWIIIGVILLALVCYFLLALIVDRDFRALVAIMAVGIVVGLCALFGVWLINK